MALEYKFDHKGNATLQAAEPKRNYCWLIFLLSWLLVLGVGSYLFYGGYLTPADLSSEHNILQSNLRGKLNEQERLLKQQTETVTRLETQLASAQRAKLIQDEANKTLRRQLGTMELKLVEAQRKSVLYESILAPDELKDGLNIQHFGVQLVLMDQEGNSLKEKSIYKYHLVLTNIRNQNSARIKGDFLLQVAGQQDGKARKLEHTALALSDEKSLKTFSLKYYQSLEGHFKLPEGFQPLSIKVMINPSVGAKVSTKFAWDDVNKLVKKSIESKE